MNQSEEATKKTHRTRETDITKVERKCDKENTAKNLYNYFKN